MQDEQTGKKDLVKRSSEPNPLANLGTGLEGLDLTGLTPEQRQELTLAAAKNRVDIHKRAAELGIDAQALRSNLDTYSETTREMTEQNTAVTITNTRNDHLGRTEIIVGNTDAARKGKLSRSQTGEPDRTLLWLGFGVVVLIILAVAITKIATGA